MITVNKYNNKELIDSFKIKEEDISNILDIVELIPNVVKEQIEKEDQYLQKKYNIPPISTPEELHFKYKLEKNIKCITEGGYIAHYLTELGYSLESNTIYEFVKDRTKKILFILFVETGFSEILLPEDFKDKYTE